jgi:hypothetical protein
LVGGAQVSGGVVASRDAWPGARDGQSVVPVLGKRYHRIKHSDILAAELSMIIEV